MKILSKISQKRNLLKITSAVLTTGFFLFVVTYAISKTNAITQGVDLSVNGIEQGRKYTEGFLAITGNAKHAKHLLVNGREVTINQNGDFSDTLVLLPGYNIITVSAEDKFGKVTKKTYEVVREQLSVASLGGN